MQSIIRGQSIDIRLIDPLPPPALATAPDGPAVYSCRLHTGAVVLNLKCNYACRLRSGRRPRANSGASCRVFIASAKRLSHSGVTPKHAMSGRGRAVHGRAPGGGRPQPPRRGLPGPLRSRSNGALIVLLLKINRNDLSRFRDPRRQSSVVSRYHLNK